LEMEMLSQTRVSSSLPSTWTPRHPCSEGSCEVCLTHLILESQYGILKTQLPGLHRRVLRCVGESLMKISHSLQMFWTIDQSNWHRFHTMGYV
jgi:hypothetical protein